MSSQITVSNLQDRVIDAFFVDSCLFDWLEIARCSNHLEYFTFEQLCDLQIKFFNQFIPQIDSKVQSLFSNLNFLIQNRRNRPQCCLPPRDLLRSQVVTAPLSVLHSLPLLNIFPIIRLSNPLISFSDF